MTKDPEPIDHPQDSVPPAPETNSDAGRTTPSPEGGSSAPTEGSHTVLVVDDEALVREVVVKELTQAGYKVVSAADGLEAMREIDLGTSWGPRGIPDLIISDIMMPGMDGFEFCQRVKDNPRLKPIPFLFLSVKRDTADRARAFLLGCQRYIVKPFTRRGLLKAVNERLADIQQTQALLAKHQEVFEGDLADYTVLSLVDLFLIAGWSGRLTIRSHDMEGRIEFRAGEIAQVLWGEKEGEDALAYLLAQVEGAFKVERGSAPPPV